MAVEQEESSAESYCCVTMNQWYMLPKEDFPTSFVICQSNFNLYYISLVWEYHVREYQKPHENQHMWFSASSHLTVYYTVEGKWTVWNLSVKFMLAFIHHQLLFKHEKEQNPNLTTCPEKFWKAAAGLVCRFLFSPVLKVSLLDHKKTTNDYV